MNGPTRGASRSARAGFSFIEILVVMAIIAVLVGIGIGIYTIVVKKTPELKCKNLLMNIRANVDLFKGKFRALPPTDFGNLPTTLGIPMKIGKPVPSNTTNPGIEALYQALNAPDLSIEIGDDARANTDEDALDKPFAPSGDAALWEIVDPWGSPFVYFTEGDYATAEKQPPTYINGDGQAVNPKPLRVSEGAGFAQPNSFQLYSMGPDKQPNTEDDVKAWE